jgi:rhodanese-related sulfurtransferase
VTVVAGNHAGYYPGAETMLLKLLYAPEGGKVLGAQAVGGAGVDKRIDVIATALRMGGTVYELAELDLSYAPPFGSAKHPVHMVAFAATNQLMGFVDFVGADADLSGMQVVDVRNGEEVAKASLTDAVHVPLDTLRENLDRLDRGRPTVVVCHTGLRGNTAARFLRQSGFEDVSILSGGMVLRGLTNPEDIFVGRDSCVGEERMVV